MEIYTSLSGLTAAQRMLQTAQNNIANVGNDSYSREVVDVSANPSAVGSGSLVGEIGTGVIVNEIRRIRDEQLIQQSRSESGKTSYYQAKSDALTSVESVFGETGDNGLNQLMQNMFNSFQNASKFPEEQSYRVQTISDAEMFVNKVRSISDQLDTIENQTDTKIKNDVTKINQLLQSIADVNKQMSNTISENPNSLLDERDKYLDELSKYMDINVIQKGTPASMQITVNGINILSGTQTQGIRADFDSSTAKWTLSSGSLEIMPKSGTLAGDVEARNVDISNYNSQLNTLIGSIISNVNSLHSSGYGLDGSTGLNFFQGTDIRSIQVNSLLQTNPEKLALSSANGVSGNSDIGKAIADLADTNIVSGTNPVNYYQGLAVQMGTDLNKVNTNLEAHTNVYQAITTQRQSVQGVNIDEEMSNLLTYQQFYQANAKTMKTMNELFTDLIGIFN